MNKLKLNSRANSILTRLTQECQQFKLSSEMRVDEQNVLRFQSSKIKRVAPIYWHTSEIKVVDSKGAFFDAIKSS